VATASAQFTDINAAVSYAQKSGIPSISVLAGTYSAVTVAGTQTLTISGPSASAVSDNQVVITSNDVTGSVSFGTSAGRGLTLRNLNLTNTATTGVGPAVNAKGVNLGIYTCALVSSAQGVYQASYGITVIANSLVQGTDKLFYNYPTAYIYGSTIIPTSSGSSIFYGKGAAISGVNYNATLVVDSSSVQGPASNVYLATPNGVAGLINVVYRNSTLSSVIAASGVYSTACSAPGSMFGEFQNSGSGSYSSNVASRGAASCDYLLSADQVSAYTVSKVFANAFSGFASDDLSWVDSSVLESIKNSDAAQISSASATPSASSTASASTGASSTCATPTPSATLIVSQNATDCKYANISAAITALPNDNQPYTIKIEAGQYNEQISITRNGKVTLIGESDSPADYSQNKVTVQFSRGELTSAGKNEQTPVLNVKKTGSSPDFATYNINFVNTYPQTPNTAALAADYYGSNFAAYGCSFIGFQDTLLANKGVQVFANSYIEGSIDFIWGFSTAYFYRSVISSNTKGAYIAAQGRVADTISGYVFDECKVTYKESTYGNTFGSTYLGRPYSNYSTVVYKNSYLDKHINPAGWTIWSTGSPQTSNVVFGEFNNTGPGSWQAESTRPSYATKMSLDQVAPYSLSSWVGDTSFIDQKAWNYPSPYDANTTSTPDTTGTPTTSSGSTSTASVNVHPEDGKAPPQYALTVSQSGEGNGSFSNISAALASLPNDNTNQTIFIYAGEYLRVAKVADNR
jgi:pectin methylesterase-like acyl-CoA thioesterase